MAMMIMLMAMIMMAMTTTMMTTTTTTTMTTTIGNDDDHDDDGDGDGEDGDDGDGDGDDDDVSCWTYLSLTLCNAAISAISSNMPTSSSKDTTRPRKRSKVWRASSFRWNSQIALFDTSSDLHTVIATPTKLKSSRLQIPPWCTSPLLIIHHHTSILLTSDRLKSNLLLRYTDSLPSLGHLQFRVLELFHLVSYLALRRSVIRIHSEQELHHSSLQIIRSWPAVAQGVQKGRSWIPATECLEAKLFKALPITATCHWRMTFWSKSCPPPACSPPDPVEARLGNFRCVFCISAVGKCTDTGEGFPIHCCKGLIGISIPMNGRCDQWKGNKITFDFNHELHHVNNSFRNLHNVRRMNLWGTLSLKNRAS